MLRLMMLMMIIAAVPAWSCAAAVVSGSYYEVRSAPSELPGELKLGVSYKLWVPNSSRPLRAIIVHQHGCGAGACQGGATAAYDLHWQALAAKWNCALLGPSYEQSDSQECALWCDPRKGSDHAFLKAIEELARAADRPELSTVPWCLWGHSGGGYWAWEMLRLHPERVVAVWQRSGAARFFDNGAIEEIPDRVLKVPMVCNPGQKEKSDRFARIWEGMVELTRSLRAKGAPVCLAPDPRTSHECGDSRYLAIPFFDICLSLRLPKQSGEPMREVPAKGEWLAPILGTNISPAKQFTGNMKDAVWLPNESFARAWAEYVSTGTVGDLTPPSSPRHLRVSEGEGGALKLEWDAEADFESGLRGFIVLREGSVIGRVPEKDRAVFGRPVLQGLTYHDTPEEPVPITMFLDRHPPNMPTAVYEVVAINGAGLQSKPARITAKFSKHSKKSKRDNSQ